MLAFLRSIFSALSASANDLPPSPPHFDVCYSGQCCVRKDYVVGGHFPYDSSMPVLQLWAPFMPWSEVLTLGILCVVVLPLVMLLGCCVSQAVWLSSNARRRYELLSKRETSAKVHSHTHACTRPCSW